MTTPIDKNKKKLIDNAFSLGRIQGREETKKEDLEIIEEFRKEHRGNAFISIVDEICDKLTKLIEGKQEEGK